MKKTEDKEIQFAVCIRNEGYPASLEIGKLYRIVTDDQAAAHGYIRIIDESGEDYAYTKDRFFPIVVPEVLEKTLLEVAQDSNPARL